VSVFPVLTADFDQDTDVDGVDFLAWQRGFGIQPDATGTQWLRDTRDPADFTIGPPQITTTGEGEERESVVEITWSDAQTDPVFPNSPMTYGVTLATDPACSQVVESASGLTGLGYEFASVPDGTYYLCVTATDRLQTINVHGVRMQVDCCQTGILSRRFTKPSSPLQRSTPVIAWSSKVKSSTSATKSSPPQVQICGPATCKTP
jgi:hypothetical protein